MPQDHPAAAVATGLMKSAFAHLCGTSLMLALGVATACGGQLRLTSPRNYEVFQRQTKERGQVLISGELDNGDAFPCRLEARIGGGDSAYAWTTLDPALATPSFSARLEAPSGGWFRIEVRAIRDGQVLGSASVEHVGVGEVFVVAGQSNSANHGEEKQSTRTGRVSSFDGHAWQLANDPQEGASGGGGSFMPPLGDILAERWGVPIGFIPCGSGGTSVREWLPAGIPFSNPPTVERHVEQRPDGRWVCDGQLFQTLVSRIKTNGPGGFRAVLWHQGESDANQKDATRTLAGPYYQEYLTTVIRESSRQIGWKAPWFVAQASYHTPDDPASPEIRAAQAALWKDGTALAGPDTDALRGDLRQNNGQGVHFSGKGLREHAARWADKLVPWVEKELR